LEIDSVSQEPHLFLCVSTFVESVSHAIWYNAGNIKKFQTSYSLHLSSVLSET